MRFRSPLTSIIVPTLIVGACCAASAGPSPSADASVCSSGVRMGYCVDPADVDTKMAPTSQMNMIRIYRVIA